MSKHYETVIIFSPVLSDEDLKKSVTKYTKLLSDHGANIVEERNWGLKQLAYPIQNKSNGIYYIIEFTAPGNSISKVEVEFRRDENILRFLTTALDKYAIEYNEKRRQGLVGKGKKTTETSQEVAS
jgi:small subunit ribosomal protein S6